MNNGEKLTRPVSSQPADSPRKTPALANRGVVTQVLINRRVASSNLAQGANLLILLQSFTDGDFHLLAFWGAIASLRKGCSLSKQGIPYFMLALSMV